MKFEADFPFQPCTRDLAKTQFQLESIPLIAKLRGAPTFTSYGYEGGVNL
jgi:hypothetical protein